MAQERLRLRTYSQVWRLERVIYRIERVPLPFPVTVTQVGVFAGALVVMVILTRLGLTAGLPVTVRYALAPGLAAWFLTRQSLDGKLPHLWLAGMAAYLLGPRRLGRLRALPAPRRLRFRPRVAYRLTPGGEAAAMPADSEPAALDEIPPGRAAR